MKQSILARALWLVLAPAFLAPLATPQHNDPPFPLDPIIPLEVKIYRDANGVPHIESDDEWKAWYALGYEEARDALYWVQVNLKRFRGQLSLFLPNFKENGTGTFGHGSSFDNDAFVQLLESDLFTAFNGDEDLLAEYLRRQPYSTLRTVGDPDQVYKNLRAYAEGLNDYRKRLLLLAQSDLNKQEKDHRSWLNQNAPWVLQERITVWEVAAFGPWVMRMGGIPAAETTDLSRFCVDFDGPCDEVIVVPAPTEDPFHEDGEPLPEGSNAFCWNYEYSQGPMQYSGVMGDATGKAALAYVNDKANDINAVGHHRWFAHIIVPPVDLGDPELNANDPGINAFGELVHGTGMFIHFHNQNVAYGGSQASPNRGDGFLLQVKRNDDNELDYYDYYTDSWEALDVVPGMVPVRQGDGSILEKPYHVFRAGRFGFALAGDDGQPRVFYARDTTDWIVGPIFLTGMDSTRNDFWCCPPESPDDPSIAVIVALRVPGDPYVHAAPAFPNGSFKLLGRFAVGLYEALRAQDVYAFQELSSTQEAGRGTNFCAIDREGRIFAGMMGNVVRRGDDAKLCAIDGPCTTTLDKIDIYDKDLDREPVPARWESDSMYDWVFDGDGQNSGTGGVKFLKPQDKGTLATGVGNPDYLPYILLDPTDPSKNHPPVQPDTGDNTYENPGFVAASNDYVQNYYKRKTTIQFKDDPVDPHQGGSLYNKHWSPDNAVLNEILEAGTPYANRRFRIGGAGGGNPPQIDYLLNVRRGVEELMDKDAAEDFAWSNWLYGDYTYEGYFPAGGGDPVLDQDLIRLPPLIRSLEELRREMTGGPDSVLAQAHREVRFFRDLWATLWAGDVWNAYPIGGVPTSTVDLKTLWVDNGHKPNPGGLPQIFWYPDGQNIEFFEMPEDYALIDFLWSEIRLGDKKVKVTAEGDAGFGQVEQGVFANLVDDLVNWDVQPPEEPTKFRLAADSESAALLEEYLYGLNAATNGFDKMNDTVRDDAEFVEGRMWSPVSKGRVFADSKRFPDNGNWNQVQLLSLDANGNLPCEVDDDNRFTTCGQSGFLQQFFRSYNLFKDYFIGTRSLLTEDESQGHIRFHKIIRHPVPPYHALYSDPATFTVKDVSELTKQDINDLVTFFLVDLGGFKLSADDDDDDDEDDLGSTTKVDAIDHWDDKPLTRTLPWDKAYPLTRNMVRVLLMRRLLETDAYLTAKVPGRVLGSVIRTLIYDFNGVVRFPPEDIMSGEPDGRATQGKVAREEDAPVKEGFQARVWNRGGSNKPLFTLLPADPLMPAESYFCLFPGQRNGTFDSDHFPDLAECYVGRTLRKSHYMDYRTSVSPDEGLPMSPYQVPQ